MLAMGMNLQRRVAIVGHALLKMLALTFGPFRPTFPVQKTKSKHRRPPKNPARWNEGEKINQRQGSQFRKACPVIGHATRRVLRGKSFPWARLIRSKYSSRLPQSFIRLMFCSFRVFPNNFVPCSRHKILAIYGLPPDAMYLVCPSVLPISRSHNIFR